MASAKRPGISHAPRNPQEIYPGVRLKSIMIDQSHHMPRTVMWAVDWDPLCLARDVNILKGGVPEISWLKCLTCLMRDWGANEKIRTKFLTGSIMIGQGRIVWKKRGQFRLATRKKLFTMVVVKHWQRLPREVVEFPPLETLRVRLDGTLSYLI